MDPTICVTESQARWGKFVCKRRGNRPQKMEQHPCENGESHRYRVCVFRVGSTVAEVKTETKTLCLVAKHEDRATFDVDATGFGVHTNRQV